MDTLIDYLVAEAPEIADIAQSVASSRGATAAGAYARFKTIFDYYHENAQLLDPHLEGTVQPLMAVVQHAAHNPEQADIPTVQHVCRLLLVVSSVRGHKVIVRFFPNNASDLEPALALLQRTQKEGRRKTSVDEDEHGIWEAQYVIMLWLSMLVLLPFDLATIDSTAVPEASPGAASADRPDAQNLPPVVHQITTWCRSRLGEPSADRDMAALLLGRLLTRPDTLPALSEFLDWAVDQLGDIQDGPAAVFQGPGILSAIACCCEHGERATIRSFVPTLWPVLSDMADPERNGGPHPLCVCNTLARKLAVKVCQRLALAMLEPQLAPWRYQKAEMDLRETLSAAGRGPGHKGELPEAGLGAENGSRCEAAPAPAEVELEDIELTSEVEEYASQAVAILLSVLKDKDTVVRWSAAKGLGRITSRLPRDYAADVVDDLRSLFSPTQSDSAWHGGCLALAELARRSLLLPARLHEFVPRVSQALLYDVRRGPYSVGTHVRDAAAYVCWAFARAYTPEDMADSAAQLAPALLTVASYDREVNCRRAAAAAFQESVGRLGNFPHGIDILTTADYFTLSMRSHAFLEVAPFIASFAPYCVTLVQHLVDAKLQHWDVSLRELAAKALAALVPHAAELLEGQVLETLLDRCLDPQIEVRHGAALAVGELVVALKGHGVAIPTERQGRIAGLVPAIEKARLFRGKGGETMRPGVCHIIWGLSKVRLPLSAARQKKLLDSIDENLHHPNPGIQAAAVTALAAFSRAYLERADEDTVLRTVKKYAARTQDENVAVRRGYCAALGSLPSHLLSAALPEAVSSLVAATQLEEDPDERDADTRVAAAKALWGVMRETVLRTLALEDADRLQSASPQHMELLQDSVVPALLEAMGDYSIDNRGDVGSWVREAAMASLAPCLRLLSRMPGLQPWQLAVAAVAACLKQAVERIGRTRQAAAQALIQMVDDPFFPEVPGMNALRLVLKTDSSPLCYSTLVALDRLAPFLVVPEYAEMVLEGLVASIGGRDPALSQAAADRLAEVVQGRHASPAVASQLNEAILDLDTIPGALAPKPGEKMTGPASLLQSASVAAVGSSEMQQRQRPTGVVAGLPVLAELRLGARQLVDMLQRIWARHARSPRLATPLLKTLDVCYTRAGFLQLHEEEGGSTLSLGFLHLIRAEGRQCRDVVRLMAVASVLCHLLQCRGNVGTEALRSLMVLLISQFPTVRQSAAEQLYIALMQLQPENSSEDDGGGSAFSEQQLEQAQELVLETTWDGPLPPVRQARSQLMDLLNVQAPAASSKAGAKSRADVGEAHTSYQSLVDDAARGY